MDKLTIARIIAKYEIKATIFDFDGILVDTENVGMEVTKRIMMEKFGIALNEEEVGYLYGLVYSEFYSEMVKKYKLDVDVQALVDHQDKRYEAELGRFKECMPGALEILEFLRQHGIPTGICSGSRRVHVGKLVENLGISKYFKIIITVEDSNQHKPNAEPYFLAAKKLKISPKKCLVFEDSEHGVKAAKSAGMIVVGVKIGSQGRQNLGKADIVVNTLKEIIEKK